MKKFLLVLAMGLCACAGAPPPPTPQPTPMPSSTPKPAPTNTAAPSPTAITQNSYAGAVVMLSRKGGIMGMNDGWTIYPDGRIVTTGNAELKADPAKTAALFAAIEKINFFALPDYGHAEPMMCTDCIEVKITVTTPTKTHAISTIEVTRNVPQAYKDLQGMALDLVKTAGGPTK